MFGVGWDKSNLQLMDKHYNLIEIENGQNSGQT